MADVPLVKFVVIAVFVLILFSLGRAFFSLMQGKKADDTATVKALTIRVGLSIGLIAAIFIMSALGLISPNG